MKCLFFAFRRRHLQIRIICLFSCISWSFVDYSSFRCIYPTYHWTNKGEYRCSFLAVSTKWGWDGRESGSTTQISWPFIGKSVCFPVFAVQKSAIIFDSTSKELNATHPYIGNQSSYHFTGSKQHLFIFHCIHGWRYSRIRFNGSDTKTFPIKRYITYKHW